MDWFLYDNGLRHERVKMMLCIPIKDYLKENGVTNDKMDDFLTFAACFQKV